MSGLLYEDDPTGLLDRLRLLPPSRDPRMQGAAPWSGLPALPGDTQAWQADPDTFRPAAYDSGDVRRMGHRELDALAGDAPPTVASRLSFDTGGIIGGRRGALNLAGALGDRLRQGLPEAESLAMPGMTTGNRVWRETGWQRFPDGQWRMEIPDTNAHPTPSTERLLRNGVRVTDRPLREILQHDEAYRAYPGLADTPTTVNASPSEARGFNAFFEPNPSLPGGGRIVMGEAANPDFRSILLHEVNHGVQRAEGHAPGTNPSSSETQGRMGQAADARRVEMDQIRQRRQAVFNDLQTREPNLTTTQKFDHWERMLPEDAARESVLRQQANEGPNAYQYYQAALGEAEARAVQDRLALGPLGLRATSPLETMHGGPSAAQLGPLELWNPATPRLRIRRPGGLLE